MGSGGIKSSQNQLRSDASAQAQTAATAQAQSQASLDRAQGYEQPLVGFLQNIIGGDANKRNQSMAPALSAITHTTAANRENIYNQLPAGAARDYALAENERNHGSQVAAITNQTFLSAFPTLASLGGENNNLGLSLLGAGITSQGNSALTTGTVLNSQEQQKANAFGAFNSLAGAAGVGLSGGLSSFMKSSAPRPAPSIANV